MTFFTDLYRYRHAIWQLALRDLRIRYSSAALGIVWSLLNPLALTLVFTLVFTYMLPNGIAGYPVFLLAGLLPWNFFSLSLGFTTQAISGNTHLINKVAFPRAILPIAMVISNAIAFAIALVPLSLLMLVFGTPLTRHLVWVPALLGLQVLLSIGLGLILSTLNVFLRDTQQIVEVLTLPLFFITPIFYGLESVANPLARWASQTFNPVASLITAYRQVIYYGQPPDLGALGVTGATIVVLLGLGLLVFQRFSPYFADEL